MRIYTLTPCLIFISILLLSCSRYTPSPGTTTRTKEMAVPVASGNMETSILANVNTHRRSLGLSSLQMMDAANQQAFNHSKNMATDKTAFGHDGFSQRVRTIEQSAGKTTASAENVAYGSLSAKEVVNVWLNSPPHRKNMEGNYNFIGIGSYKDRRGVIYFTQIFIRK